MRLSCIPRDTASESYCDIMSLSLVKERPRFFNLIFCIFADDQELILGTICHLRSPSASSLGVISGVVAPGAAAAQGFSWTRVEHAAFTLFWRLNS